MKTLSFLVGLFYGLELFYHAHALLNCVFYTVLQVSTFTPHLAHVLYLIFCATHRLGRAYGFGVLRLSLRNWVMNLVWFVVRYIFGRIAGYLRLVDVQRHLFLRVNLVGIGIDTRLLLIVTGLLLIIV